ncbi:hypothetical protein EX30DRAFT_340268 [Ascodesmis nigricans]|uniref:Uncharacterized protein n=1 Tax=Ascodesmis nigricans TaxID=341454 RepID=A0A4S2MZ60_9PEZI|nr:hypothetical protein EX30DRAFT_340268 [Ascodesmis nigricans]
MSSASSASPLFLTPFPPLTGIVPCSPFPNTITLFKLSVCLNSPMHSFHCFGNTSISSVINFDSVFRSFRRARSLSLIPSDNLRTLSSGTFIRMSSINH